MRKLNQAGFAFVLLMTLVGCSKAAPTRKGAEPVEPAASAKAGPTDAGSGVRPRLDVAVEVFMRWNAALNARRADQLQALYAPRVAYYGVSKSAQEILDSKRAALANVPDYRQTVDGVRVGTAGQGFAITFTKHSGPTLASSVNARVTVEPMGDRWVITEETDSAAEALLKRQDPMDCADAALRVVEEHPAIREDRARAAREFPELRPGSLILENEPGLVHASVGYSHPERFESRWFLSVEKGQLSISDNLTSQPLKLDERQQAVVRRSCASDDKKPGH